MHKQIFINLPVVDLAKSKAFFAALGYAFKPEFTNDQGASVVLGNNLFAMLLVQSFFKTFTDKPLADAHKTVQVLICLSCDSQRQVDSLVAKAVAAGGTAPRPPQDHGFMYAHSFEDLDGHTWELVYMSGMPPQA
jgi:uncharacterized protein